MKKLIIAALVIVFAWGWYSDRQKQKQREESNREADAFFSTLIQGGGGQAPQTMPAATPASRPNPQDWPTFGPGAKQREYHYDNNGKPTGYSEKF